MSARSKNRLAKAAGAEVAAQSRQEKWHAAVARSTFQVKMFKTPQLRALLEVGTWKNGTPLWHEAHFKVKMLFCGSDVQKLHAAVARGTCATQNAQNTSLQSKESKRADRAGRNDQLDQPEDISVRREESYLVSGSFASM